MTMTLSEAAVEMPAPQATLSEAVNYNPAAWNVAKSMLHLAPGADREAAFREVVPVTPLVELPAAAFPQRVRGSGYRFSTRPE